MRDVAVTAGVSVKTVSRVFNEDPHVLPETRARVDGALQALNYTPNTIARTFRNGRSPVIGLAVPDIADPFFSAIAKGVEGVAARFDMSVLVSSLGEEPATERDVLESLLRRQLGALVVAPTSADHAYLGRWGAKLPLVFVDRPPLGLSADCYVEDDLGGARAATGHLVGHGHHAIAFAGNSMQVTTTRNRLEGYAAALEDAGIAYREDLVILGAATMKGARRAVGELAALSDAPTALFSSDAKTTMSLLPALSGRRWAIAAFGDFPMASMLSPALTVVDQDPVALGRAAAERAIERLDGDLDAGSLMTTLPVRLLERQSCLPSGHLGGLFPLATPDGVEHPVWTSGDPAPAPEVASL